MKRKIISFLLVATMLMTFSPFAFAEELDLGDSSGVEVENIEKNDTLIENEQVDLGVEDLDVNKEQISSNPVYEVNDDTEIIDGVLGAVEGSVEPSEPTEVTTPSLEKNSSEETSEEYTEQLDDEFGVDDGFGVDSEENIDSAFGVDSGESNIGSLEDEDEGFSSDNVYIDPTQDDSGYVVIETPEDAYEGLDIDGPTATEEDPEDAVDPGFTISAEEETKGQEIAREPLIFKTYDGMTLYRRENGTIAVADYTCTNNTGVDVYLVGVEVIPINGWEMVGYEVDFKNMKSDTREFRLTVNNQVILDYDGDGFISMNDPEIYFDGEEIRIPMDLEIGPFKNGLNEGMFTFVLVFEEIIKDEVVEVENKEVQTESKEESQEIIGETQEENKNIEENNEIITEETEQKDSQTDSQDEILEEEEIIDNEPIIEEESPILEESEETVDNSETTMDVESLDNLKEDNSFVVDETEENSESSVVVIEGETENLGDVKVVETKSQTETSSFDTTNSDEETISEENTYTPSSEEESVVENENIDGNESGTL